ncbi:MAG TPA: PAS domain S-box protein [Candidatus Koribacter sp.]
MPTPRLRGTIVLFLITVNIALLGIAAAVCLWSPHGARVHRFGFVAALTALLLSFLAERAHIKNVAEQTRVCESLLQSESRFRALIEDAPVAVAIARGTEFIYVNPKFVTLFGYDNAEEIIGQPVISCSAPESRLEVEERIRIRATGALLQPSHWEGGLLRKGGSAFVGRIDVACVRLPDGIATMGFVTDITRRKRAEEALRKAETEYRTIFEQAVEGIFQTTPAGRPVGANPAMAKILGYDSPDEMLCRVIDSGSQVWGDPKERAAYVAQLERDGMVRGYETQHLRKDGSRIWVSLNGRVARDEQGEILYFEGFLEDITRRKQLEQQFLHAQKMEAVGQLAGGVAHDFNNLLGIITGYADLLAEDSALPQRARQRIAQISKAAEEAVAVTRQLLAFSRRQVLQTIALDLNVTVRETVKMLGRVLGEDIALTVSLAEELGTIQADPTGIDQIILNLAINARDAMPDGGTLTIETANVFLDESNLAKDVRITPGEYAMLAVSDTGTGIDAETQKRIFEPFFTTKGLGRGTGLGLSTVYGIVRQTGAHIRVYSEVDVGTAFKIYFHRVAESANIPSKQDREILQGGSETILLVEDDSTLRKLNLELLTGLGYNVLPAANASEALNIVHRYYGPLDLLLTDIVMPGMNGKQLADELIAIQPSIRVLFVSGYSENILRDRSLQPGSDFLQKPFAKGVLAKKIRELLIPQVQNGNPPTAR